jgi:hypothetical protein
LVLWTLNALDLKGRSSSKLSLGWTPGHVLVHYPLHFRRQRRGRQCSVSLRKATAFTEPRRWPTPALAPLCCDVLSPCHVAGHLHVPPRCACDTSRILCFRGTPCASDTATPVALGLTAPMSLASWRRSTGSPIQYALCPWARVTGPFPVSFLQKSATASLLSVNLLRLLRNRI